MTARNYFHVGLLVADLERAIERFSDVLGLTFTPPQDTFVQHMVEDGRGRSSHPIRIAYSREGPPYYELLEQRDDGLYGRQHGEGMHHLGFWEPMPETRLRELTERHGLRWEATQETPDGLISVTYTYPQELHGVRLELVNEGRRPTMERWIAGGPWE